MFHSEELSDILRGSYVMPPLKTRNLSKHSGVIKFQLLVYFCTKQWHSKQNSVFLFTYCNEILINFLQLVKKLHCHNC